MGALKDLLASERGLLGLALIVAVTILMALGHVTYDQWNEYTLKVFGLYAAAKTITSAAAIIKGAPVAAPPAPPAA